MYPFDPTRSKFFFLDIDQQHASATSQITLYAVDPTDGSSAATAVTGGHVLCLCCTQCCACAVLVPCLCCDCAVTVP